MARILVIDDEPVVGNLFRRVLEREGHRVAVADGGRAGLDALAEETADLVIVDMVMPDLDGLSTIRRIRQRDPSARVIAMTGALASLCTADKLADACGTKCALHKPLTPETILAAVDGMLGLYRRRRGTNTWHWTERCSRWPEADYFEWQGKPEVGRFCLECRTKSS